MQIGFRLTSTFALLLCKFLKSFPKFILSCNKSLNQLEIPAKYINVQTMARKVVLVKPFERLYAYKMILVIKLLK